ncbi:hypothetical protein [Natronorubrum texcoconense]|uniref:Uncharacterized protein n=1 Tax=Natronorubrum texcoconense TaxID=1095776 RepID=A0A1G8T0E3_9EURY|nr:hypothetical protein [Natronorubrum texcoconense]SDJ34893.1 hypothetical protein SAMN04515672_0269 [Natronorubrum texcoconense]
MITGLSEGWNRLRIRSPRTTDWIINFFWAFVFLSAISWIPQGSTAFRGDVLGAVYLLGVLFGLGMNVLIHRRQLLGLIGGLLFIGVSFAETTVTNPEYSTAGELAGVITLYLVGCGVVLLCRDEFSPDDGQ